MARTRTLTQLIADVRQRADAEQSQHVSDAEITRYINQGIARLHAKIVEMDEDEFATDLLLSVPAGVSSVEMTTTTPEPGPVVPYKILSVDEIADSGEVRNIRRFMTRERARLTSSANAGDYTTRYRLRGLNTILFVPPFESATTVSVTYVASSVDLVSGADSYDGRDGWEEWVTLDAAIKVLLKEETDPSGLMAERDRVEADIRVQIAHRDRAEPPHVRDVIGIGDIW